MTEAERFLHERLNPAKTSTSIAQTAVVEETVERPPVLGFLSHPSFSHHRIFWSIGFVLMIALIDLLIMVATDAFTAIDRMSHLNDDHALALIVSFITPITFWIPILVVAQWAWNRKFVKCLAWAATVWMVVIHLCKIGALFTARGISAGQILIGIIVFLIGALGIGAVLWNLVTMKAAEKSTRTNPASSMSHRQKVVHPLTKRNVAILCTGCKKKFNTTVTSSSDFVDCTYCGAENALMDLETSIEMPTVCRIARRILYVWGVLALLGFISNMIGISGRSGPSFDLVQFSYMLLTFAMASGIKQGRNWARILAAIIAVLCLMGLMPLLSQGSSSDFGMFIFIALLLFVVGILPAILVFLPRSNDWFAVKTMLRKSREKSKGESHVH